MYRCMYICISIYLFIYTYIYIYMYIHIHIYICVYINLSLSIYIYIYIYTHTYTYTRNYTYSTYVRAWRSFSFFCTPRTSHAPLQGSCRTRLEARPTQGSTMGTIGFPSTSILYFYYSTFEYYSFPTMFTIVCYYYSFRHVLFLTTKGTIGFLQSNASRPGQIISQIVIMRIKQ